MNDDRHAGLQTWCILELFGHRRLGGYLTEEEIGGTGFLRLDIPLPVPQADEKPYVTQLYNPSAVYAITPVSEDIAREVARNSPVPISSWDLRNLLPASPTISGSSSMNDPDDEPGWNEDDLPL